MSPRPLLIPLAVFVLFIGAACGPDQGAYVVANEAIIDELSFFPGAVEIARESHSYSFQESAILDAPEGYGTLVTYRVPTGTSQSDLFDFYSSAHVPEWEVVVEIMPTVGLAAPNSDYSIAPTPASVPPMSAATADPALEPVRILRLCRGDSLVSIDGNNLRYTGTFGLYVDHSFGQPGQQTAC